MDNGFIAECVRLLGLRIRHQRHHADRVPAGTHRGDGDHTRSRASQTMEDISHASLGRRRAVEKNPNYRCLAVLTSGVAQDRATAALPGADRRRRAADRPSRRHGKRHDDEFAQLRGGAGKIWDGSGLYRHLHAQAPLCAGRQDRRPEPRHRRGLPYRRRALLVRHPRQGQRPTWCGRVRPGACRSEGDALIAFAEIGSPWDGDRGGRPGRRRRRNTWFSATPPRCKPWTAGGWTGWRRTPRPWSMRSPSSPRRGTKHSAACRGAAVPSHRYCRYQ